ncbi:MAG: hypothetical protein ABJA79_05015 [Parafilimonas sp.]
MKQFFLLSATFVLCCIAYKNVIAQNSNPVCGWKPLANNFRLTKKRVSHFKKSNCNHLKLSAMQFIHFP